MSDVQDWARALSEQALCGGEAPQPVREAIDAILATTPDAAAIQLETARAAFAVALATLKAEMTG
ncbi:MAG: hypothetical protein QF629_05925 [Alphaproteobacteria bacterium]|jgi:hypothetical protein|nr:hypothetical protein [Alphaproteobacteria bacterium]MDP7172815.1 hypothetical protein [Alphaproteobacteria bacterium]MDP7232585.1 hypothetical protein [Alphaproteobacteria bacterium]MDP7487196.1 hypothetical protein [Alphaproteobacteria bacterium]HJN20691.1 hypothetical protein [Alphaproteobacteria bacterium]|tara:strand:- start:8262 stop:8456 length:195 start_codon:yes stop_codon:yes gene_type:complete